MLVHYCCVYYSELAHNKISKRTEPYWQSRAFSWAVKTGQFKNKFTVLYRKKNISITRENINKARLIFGNFIDAILKQENADEDTLLIPVPSRDAILDAPSYRSHAMTLAALDTSTWRSRIYDGLRWTELLAKAHEGGPRGREELKAYLRAVGDLEGKKVYLIDDIFTKGGSLLASKDVLEAAGAQVLGAITAAKTVHDFNTVPYGYQKLELTKELNDYAGQTA